MNRQVLRDPAFYYLQITIDEELAAEVRKKGCPGCGAKFHDGGFERVARGCPKAVLEEYSWRTSLDCSGCRQRTMPPSVRFLHRRVWIAAVLALVSPHGSAMTCCWLTEHLEVSRRTLERWRKWWRNDFLTTPVWQTLRGQFPSSPPCTRALPESLLDRIEGSSPMQCLQRFLRDLSPLSVAVVRK